MGNSRSGLGNASKIFNINVLYDSIQGMFDEVEKHFLQPALIDERARKHFTTTVMENAPALTEGENAMLRKVRSSEKALYEKGKRVKGSLKDGIDKFTWREVSIGGQAISIDKTKTR
jgi:hypothetical protein